MFSFVLLPTTSMPKTLVGILVAWNCTMSSLLYLGIYPCSYALEARMIRSVGLSRAGLRLHGALSQPIIFIGALQRPPEGDRSGTERYMTRRWPNEVREGSDDRADRERSPSERQLTKRGPSGRYLTELGPSGLTRGSRAVTEQGPELDPSGTWPIGARARQRSPSARTAIELGPSGNRATGAQTLHARAKIERALAGERLPKGPGYIQSNGARTVTEWGPKGNQAAEVRTVRSSLAPGPGHYVIQQLLWPSGALDTRALCIFAQKLHHAPIITHSALTSPLILGRTAPFSLASPTNCVMHRW